MVISFIGCGNMGGALASAVCKSNTLKEVLLCDKNFESAKTLATKIGATAVETKQACEKADYLFLGVKPQFLQDLVSEIKGFFANSEKKPIIISMLAGGKIQKIKDLLGQDFKVIRIMPNTPVSVEQGMVLYTASSDLTDSEIATFKDFMQKTGKLDMLDESLIDSGCALSGCGPAFAYMFIEGLIEGGIKCGLSKEQATAYAEQTLLGASKLAIESKKEPIDLRIAVCSPNGSTIEGVKVLEDNNFREIIVKCVEASFKRTKELGK